MPVGTYGQYLSGDWGRVDNEIRVSFPTSGVLTTGVGIQEFRVQVRKKSASGGDVAATVELYEAGVFKATVVAQTIISSTTGVVLSGSWNASLLTDQTGASVECKVVGQGNINDALEVGAIEWNALYTPTIIAGLLSTSQVFYGASFTVGPVTINAGLIPTREASYGAALTPGAVNIGAGVIPSFQASYGTTVSTSAAPVNAGFIPTSERSYGASVEIPAVNTSVTVSFPLPDFTLYAGANLQEFRVGVRKKGTGANPSVSLELWEDGVFRSTLLTQSISTTTVLAATWDPTLLANTSGAGVELKVVGAGVAGGSVEVGAVEWNATLADEKQITAGYIDAGESYGTRVHGPPQDLTAGFIDAPDFYGAEVSNPYIQASILGPRGAGEFVSGDYPPEDIKDESQGLGATVRTEIGAGVIPTSQLEYGVALTPGAAQVAAGRLDGSTLYGATLAARIEAGYSTEGSREYGAALTAGAATLTAGFISSQEKSYSTEITPGDVSVEAALLSEHALYGADVQAGPVTVAAGFLGDSQADYGATAEPGAVTLTAGFIGSSEATYGAQATPGPVAISAGLLEDTRFYGASVAGGPVSVTGGLIPSAERSYGSILATNVEFIQAGSIPAPATFYGVTFVQGAGVITGGFISDSKDYAASFVLNIAGGFFRDDVLYGGTLVNALQFVTGGFAASTEASYGAQVIAISPISGYIPPEQLATAIDEDRKAIALVEDRTAVALV